MGGGGGATAAAGRGDVDDWIKRLSMRESQEKAKKWMIRTTEYCAVVAAVIVLSTYATTLIPLGKNNDEGFPRLWGRECFSIFLASNAIAFMFPLISILLFLSVLTSQYEIKDFPGLRTRLRLGFIALCIAIIGKALNFSVVFFLKYQSKMAWFLTTTLGLTIVSAILSVGRIYKVGDDVCELSQGKANPTRPGIGRGKGKAVFISGGMGAGPEAKAEGAVEGAGARRGKNEKKQDGEKMRRRWGRRSKS